MNGHHARAAALVLTATVAFVSTTFRPARAADEPTTAPSPTSAPSSMFELRIDDKTIDLSEGSPTTMQLDGRQVTVTVVRKPLQPYATNAISFAYSSEFSLEDDHEKESRTISMMHASGVAVVITDHGSAADSNPQAVLKTLVDSLRQSFTRGKTTNYEASKAQAVRFPLAKGQLVRITYTDEDGDDRRCDVYLLESNGRAFSVLSPFDAVDSATADRLIRPTLETIAGR